MQKTKHQAIMPQAAGPSGSSGGRSSASHSSVSQSSAGIAAPRPVVPCTCPDCGATNTTDRKFCAGCGAAIWEPCVSCGEQSLAGEKFCGACGPPQAEALQQRIDRIETQEMYARSLQVTGKHREAIAALTKALADEHPRLRKLLEPLKELRDELQAELAGWDAQRRVLIEAARACIADFDFDGAVERLRELPDGARDEEARKLLAAAEARQREIASLTDTIREGMAAKQYDGLLAKIDRLLTIKPNHGPAAGLREKLSQFESSAAERHRDSVCKTAAQRLKAHKYAEALRLLDEIPAATPRGEQFDKILEYAREAACLDFNLREGAASDEHLPALARRMLKVSSEDPLAKKLLAELSRKTPPANGGLLAAMAARGAKLERTSLFGCPLTTLRGFERIALADGVATLPAWVGHESGLAVAAGLALQGIGQAQIDVNLRPPETGLVRKLLSGAVRKKPGRAAWGIDLGRNSLKAVRLSAADDGRVVCEAVDVVEYATPLSQPGADANALIKEALGTFAGRQAVKDVPLVMGMQGQELFTRFFKTPPIDRKRLDDLVQYEARNQIPFDLELFSWGYHVLGTAAQRAADFAEYQVAVFAIKIAHIAPRLALLNEVGLRADTVQCDAVALHNFLAYDRLPPGGAGRDEKDALGPADLVVMLDIGGDTTNFLVSSGDFLWLRNFGWGGNDITKAILRELKLTFAQAEALKRAPATAPRVWRFFQAAEPAVEQLATHVQHSLRCCENLIGDRPIRQMLLHGDACRLHGLARCLRPKAL